MNSNSFTTPPVVHLDPATNLLNISEFCGLDHERQIVTVACPPDLPKEAQLFSFRDDRSEFPAQRSRQNPKLAFLQLELRAGASHRLAARAQAPKLSGHQVSVTPGDKGHSIISNGKWAVELFLGEWKAKKDAEVTFDAPGPIRRLRLGEGPWRGNSFFETRQPVRRVSSTVLESGPLRIVTEFRAEIGDSQFYTARLTFDAGLDFVRIEEDFNAGSGDQIVWDFTGADLPEEIHLTDNKGGFATLPLSYFVERRMARMSNWTQCSQLPNISDGYVVTFPKSDDAVGYVTLQGGDWNGNALNFLEAWTRRWLPSDPASRRLVPWDAKADGSPSPERISCRPANVCEEHFSVEGWIGRGHRCFALLVAAKPSLRAADWDQTPALGHFDTQPDRANYRKKQSLPRRIHTQHGIFPLADQLALCWSWPVEKAPDRIVNGPAPWETQDGHGSRKSLPIPERITAIMNFLEARVAGFWDGSGSSYTNPVVIRVLASTHLPAWEWLEARGHLTPEQSRKGRAWLVFLAQLFSSDHYYPGAASMGMGDPDKQMEPTIGGMANQNFLTDCFNLPGFAAQVLYSHPQAAFWREHFTRLWKRQLEYHVYPESGLWEESHTYYQHVLITVVPTLERRRDDGVDNGFADPAFHLVVSSLPRMFSPQDSCFGKRYVVPLGDHGVDLKNLHQTLYRDLAVNLAKTAPALAAQLAWCYQESGGKEVLPVKPVALPWRSEYIRGLGYFFRARDSRGESLMVFRNGTAWAHHNQDDGSIQFIGAGRSWIVDSAFSNTQENNHRKHGADGHSRWLPRDLQMANIHFRFNRGWITRHQTEGVFPYAIGFTTFYPADSGYNKISSLPQPIVHWRGIVQLTPHAFLIMDRTAVELAQFLRFHVPLDAPLALEEEAAPSAAGPYLRLRSLMGLKAPKKLDIDRPVMAEAKLDPARTYDPAKRFATQEVFYDMSEKSLSAILVLIEDGGSPSMLKVDGGEKKISIRHADFAADLEVRTPDTVHLTNLKTGGQMDVPLV